MSPRRVSLPTLARPGSPFTRFAMASAVAMLLATAGCAASDPPPTNPLADPVSPTPSAATTPTTPAPLPTFVPTTVPPATPLPPDLEAERERVVGEAISRLAEWTGAPATEFRLLEVEAVEWPSACIGVEMPDIACADVITPGYRIALAHAGRPQGPPYLVHASTTGRYGWVPALDAVRVVETVSGNLVAFEAVSGSDEMGSTHRAAPGSLLDPAMDALARGDRVHVAVTWPLPDEEVGLIVWLVRVE